MNHRDRNYFMLVASLLIALFLVAQLNATTLVRMDLNALAHSAEIIVRARCIHSEVRWDSQSIWTFDDFDVLETLKGASSQILRLRLPGGRMDHMEVKVEGVPMFAIGEEAVLFVERTSAGDYGVTSWAQGTFRIHREAKGDARLTQDTSHFAVFDPQSRQFATVGIRNLPMNGFREQLARALAAPGPTKQSSSGSKL
jgi:hypothetical protein